MSDGFAIKVVKDAFGDTMRAFGWGPPPQEGDGAVTDREARRIACDWHGGGGSALYALCSTGAIDAARGDHDLAAEIRECIEIADREGYGPDSRGGYAEEDRDDLVALLEYAQAHGPRGPIEGWGRLD